MRQTDELQRLPAPENRSRVETGPVQFGGDWPGVFIRGDNALYYAMALEQVLNGTDPGLYRRVAKGLVETLRACHAGKFPTPPSEGA